jgi:shikimate O-hydroxycinnamoyltransferase
MRTSLLKHGRATGRRMSISPLDAYEDHFPVAYVAFYRKTLDPGALRRALEEILPHYPLLTGRMSWDARGHKAIALNDAGLGFEIDETHETLADWRDPDRNAIGRFVRTIVPQHPLRMREPLCHVRVTQLAGGGSVLGVGMGHVLADGSGIARFFSDWAKAARGERVVAPMSDRFEMARTFGTPSFDPARVPVHALSYHGLHEASLGELAKLYAFLLGTLPRWVSYTVPLRGEHIEGLKAQANAGASEKLSSNDVLSAYLWKLLLGATDLPAAHRTRFFGVTDLRPHTPGVPARGVFGNMSGHTTIEATAHAALRADLRELAQTVRRESRAITPERFQEQDEWLRHRQRSRRMYRVLAAEPYAGDVAISNCRYIPFYDTDFGGGRPYSFVRPAEAFPRVVLWPAADGDGCVLDLCLMPEHAAKVLPALTQRRPLALEAIEGAAAC